MINVLAVSAQSYVITSFGCREAGVIIQNVDITCGDVTVSLNEELLSKKKKSPDAFNHSEKVMESTSDSGASVKPDKKQASLATLTKSAYIFPEKASDLQHAL